MIPLLSLLTIRPPAQPPRIVELSLQRTRCFGTCPAYTLVLHADGKAEYRGEAFVKRIGLYRGTFPTQELARAAKLIDGWGYWKLNPRFSMTATDLPTQTVKIKTAIGIKEVVEYGPSGPDGLHSVQALIDKLGAGIKDWKRVGK